MPSDQLPRELISNSERETKSIASKLALSNIPCPVCLYGNLGTGKTVFVKGFAEAFGIDEKKVKSPTFSFVREYTLPDKILSHCDFYRIDELDEILAEQLVEAYEKGPVIIEWAEKAKNVLPKIKTEIFFEYIDKNKRRLTIKIHD